MTSHNYWEKSWRFKKFNEKQHGVAARGSRLAKILRRFAADLAAVNATLSSDRDAWVMSIIAPELAVEPDVTRQDGETLYRWGDTLGVIVLASGEIGQFSTSLRLTRQEVEEALADL